MRRTDRACCEPEFLDALLRGAEDMAIAFRTEDFPYVIPVNFVLHEGAICFHCATEGRKLDCIRQDPRVAFTMYRNVRIVPEKSTTYYESLCGEGIAELVEDTAEKQAILAALAQKYHARCTIPASEQRLAVTGVVRIRIVSLSGKRHK